MCQETYRKQFSPMSRFCEARASLFCARKDRESSFHHCGGTVQLSEICLSARNDRESSFHHCGGSEKLVQACLCDKKYRESSFHYSGGAVQLAGGLFQCQEGTGKRFSSLWRF